MTDFDRIYSLNLIVKCLITPLVVLEVWFEKMRAKIQIKL